MINGLILSFQLFSGIPIKKEVDFSKENLRFALYFLPLVGLTIGLITGGLMYLFSSISPLVVSAIGLTAYFFLSGGLHLDGLSDMADGFMANVDRERTLEIMKDSLIGSFGTIVLILYFFFKFSLYTAIIDNQVIISLGITSMLSRTSVLLSIKNGSLARPDGFGSKMKEALEEANALYLIVAIIYIISILVSSFSLSAIIAGLLVNLLMVGLSNRKLGGLTGDIYGAIIEVSEIGILLVWRRFIIWI